jgi:hypothetical protein
MSITEAEGKNIVQKLQESLLTARKSDDRLLIYLIERALFQAEKIAAEILTPASDNNERTELPAFMGIHKTIEKMAPALFTTSAD